MNLSIFPPYQTSCDLIHLWRQKVDLELHRQLKRLSRRTWVKLLLQANAAFERSLKATMSSLRWLESTQIARFFSRLGGLLLGAVQRDGLKLIGFVTVFGYGVWCLMLL